MKLKYLFIFAIVLLGSCRKNRIYKPSVKKSTANSSNNYSLKIANYIGVPYKFGGEDTNGMDCSGLLFVCFKPDYTDFPRISYIQADYFPEINENAIAVGDLVFFKVFSDRINHTGIISKIISKNDVKFIHSSVSKGVVEDNLYSNYWNTKIVKFTRPKK